MIYRPLRTLLQLMAQTRPTYDPLNQPPMPKALYEAPGNNEPREIVRVEDGLSEYVGRITK